MPLHDAFANGEADTGSRKFLFGVQALEHHKNAFEGVGFDTDPLIANRDPRFSLGLDCAQVDPRRVAPQQT